MTIEVPELNIEFNFMSPVEYIIVKNSQVVERIMAVSADEAQAKRTKAGILYLRVGDQ